MAAVVHIRGFEKETTELDLKNHLKQAGAVKTVEIKSRIATVTYANAKFAAKAVAELDRSTIDGQTRYIEVQAEAYPKKSKSQGSKKEKDPSNCKWCEKGECWDHGDTPKPPGHGEKKERPQKNGASKVKKNNIKQKGGGNGGMWVQVSQLMQQLGGKGGGKGKKAKGKGGGNKKDCKWCKMGQCWSH